jgi:hypothetical protein
MGEREAPEQDLRNRFAVHCQYHRNVDLYERKLQKAGEKQMIHCRKAEKGFRKIQRRRGEEIIGNIQRSFGVVQQSAPAPVGGMESGDEMKPGPDD